MFRDSFVENGTHTGEFLVKSQPIRKHTPYVLTCEYPLQEQTPLEEESVSN